VEEDKPSHRATRSDDRDDQSGSRVSDQTQVIERGEGCEDSLCEAAGIGKWVVQGKVYRRGEIRVLLG
jgi:hypothetical protein